LARLCVGAGPGHGGFHLFPFRISVCTSIRSSCTSLNPFSGSSILENLGISYFFFVLCDVRKRRGIAREPNKYGLSGMIGGPILPPVSSILKLTLQGCANFSSSGLP
jgi:hypothetical protein